MLAAASAGEKSEGSQSPGSLPDTGAVTCVSPTGSVTPKSWPGSISHKAAGSRELEGAEVRDHQGSENRSHFLTALSQSPG